MDLFKKAMVVCAAIGTFSGGAYLLSSGAESEALKRVEAYFAKFPLKAATETASGTQGP